MPIGARTIIKKPDKTEKKIAPFAAFFQKFGAPLDADRQTTTVGMRPRMMKSRLAKENEAPSPRSIHQNSRTPSGKAKPPKPIPQKAHPKPTSPFQMRLIIILLLIVYFFDGWRISRIPLI